jgi:hypothetical protein
MNSMCIDYLFGICERRQCKMKHKFAYCTRQICFNIVKCKYLHLSESEARDIVNNIRPFNETQTQEIDRLAYAILSSQSNNRRRLLCSRFFTGNLCNHNCLACGNVRDDAGKNFVF